MTLCVYLLGLRFAKLYWSIVGLEPAATTAVPYAPPANKLVVVLLDGLRYDAAMRKDWMPFLNRISASGARGLSRAEYPTFSPPGTRAVFTGTVAQQVFGFPGQPEMTVARDSLFRRGKAAGLLSFVSGAPDMTIFQGQAGEELIRSCSPGGAPLSDAASVAYAERILQSKAWDIVALDLYSNDIECVVLTLNVLLTLGLLSAADPPAGGGRPGFLSSVWPGTVVVLMGLAGFSHLGNQMSFSGIATMPGFLGRQRAFSLPLSMGVVALKNSLPFVCSAWLLFLRPLEERRQAFPVIAFCFTALIGTLFSHLQYYVGDCPYLLMDVQMPASLCEQIAIMSVLFAVTILAQLLGQALASRGRWGGAS
ncbi:MAG: hypothetical protein HY922_05815 [Elusimicrobia bacterium]|nr:hypothetical protein [Elusimicrobiota bacterium]